MSEDDMELLGQMLSDYCAKYNVPLDYFFEIMEDQKVLPMIRGKALEYNGFTMLSDLLPSSVWSVQKLNLNAQTGVGDEDISITHRRTGIILKTESKSCVRESFRLPRGRNRITQPQFNVKCHRSRSNIKKASTTNDRYSENDFDIILTTPINAYFKGGTVSQNLELLDDTQLRNFLNAHYGVNTDEDLIIASSADWRFCIPSDIAIDGFIPRTPAVFLEDDPNWRPVNELEARLIAVVNAKAQLGRRNRNTRR